MRPRQRQWYIFIQHYIVDLSKSVSDVHMFVSAVHDVITQVKKYKRLLEQDKVKRVHLLTCFRERLKTIKVPWIFPPTESVLKIAVDVSL